MYYVDLGESFHMNILNIFLIYLQNLASIQPRTDRLKFEGMGCRNPAPHQGSTGAISTAQAAQGRTAGASANSWGQKMTARQLRPPPVYTGSTKNSPVAELAGAA